VWLRRRAAHWLREGLGDLIAFGRKFIASFNSAIRVRIGAPLSADDLTTYYGADNKPKP
jgi:N-ethylmaleimide reductase